VIPDKDYTSKREDYAKHAKVGARSFDKVRDPDFAVVSLIEEYSEQLKKYFQIDFKNAEDFIEKVGKKKGFLLKGGVIDTDRTARYVLKEWQEGKIRA
jgi:ribosome biogenesis GTPase A